MYTLTENGLLKRIETWKMMVPLHDNSGTPFPESEIQDILEQITLQFPGMTVVNCAGYWRDSARTYKDQNFELIVDAVPSSNSESEAFFAKLKADLCDRLKQEKIYLTREEKREEFISFDEFLHEMGIEIDPSMTHDAKRELAASLNKQFEIAQKRLGYETIALHRDPKAKTIVWERRFCGMTLRSVFDDPFPPEYILVAADRIDHWENALFHNAGIVGHYEYQGFSLDRKRRPFIKACVTGSSYNSAIQYYSQIGEPLTIEEFIEDFTTSVVINYIALRSESYLTGEIKISVGADGSLQIGENQFCRVMHCPASIPDKDIQHEIIRCVGEACHLFEAGKLDEIAVLQAKARHRYVMKRAMLRRATRL